jgi:hypothetical protein
LKEKGRDKERKKKLRNFVNIKCEKDEGKLETRSTPYPALPTPIRVGDHSTFYMKGWLLNQREPFGVRLETGERRGRRLGEKKTFCFATCTGIKLGRLIVTELFSYVTK